MIIQGAITAMSIGFQQTLQLDPGPLSYDPDNLHEPVRTVLIIFQGPWNILTKRGFGKIEIEFVNILRI